MKMWQLIQAGFIISLVSSCGTIKVLKTTNNMKEFRDGSGAQLRTEQDLQLVDFSVCLRFFLFAKLDRHGIILINSNHHEQEPLESRTAIFSVMEWVSTTIYFGLKNTWNSTNIVWPVMMWHHVCLSYENKVSIMTIVGDGGRVLEKTTFEELKKNPKPIPPEFLTNLFIMRQSTPEITGEVSGSMF